MVVISQNRIANLLGLLEYVASTTSHNHKRALQQTVLNRHRQGLRQASNLTQDKIPPSLILET
jgi:mRNA-degrading endonuclease toxin of MazEF toxin-antitoxin module